MCIKVEAYYLINILIIANLRVEEVFKQPCPENTYGALRESSLRTPNRLLLVLYKPRPLTVRASIVVAKPRRFNLPNIIIYLKMRLADKLKLVSNCILQTSKMFGHCIYSQTREWRCITETGNILK